MKSPLPQLTNTIGGGSGGGQIHKRTTPKVFGHAKQLHCRFLRPRKKLIIELDGSQHMEQERYDKERTEYLESKGYTVLRFWNNTVMNDIESVIRAIIQAMESERHP